MRTSLSPAGIWAVALAAIFLPTHGRAEPAAQPEAKKPTVMQRKLTHAQKLLAALATDDFHLMRTSAEGLRDCVKDETWRINDTEKYLMYSDDFLRQTDALQAAAKKKNADAAALAYVGMTLTCVKCHRHLRDERLEKPGRREVFE
jgi:hypothetical protein